jgi:hypothetical protein
VSSTQQEWALERNAHGRLIGQRDVSNTDRRAAKPRFWARALVIAVVIVVLAPVTAGAASKVKRAPNSANRVIFWVGCDDLGRMKDKELQRWKSQGVGGFACIVHRLYGLGGDQRFTGDLTQLDGDQYVLERFLHESKIAARAHSLGMQLYMGFYFSNSMNGQTPLAEWFDDTGWSRTVLPQVHDISAAAHALGFDGLAFDQELYGQADGRATATWDWDYPGNTRPEATVRAKVQQRGAELMQNIVDAFPNTSVLAYASQFPETWDDVVQEEVNGTDNTFAKSVNIDFWSGVASVNGFDSVNFLNALFYKTTHVRDASWDDAYRYEYNRLFALLSRRVANWDKAADHVSESPFVWISSGSGSDFESARPPDYVTEQLAAARRWGMGGLFGNYTFDNLETFDYGPYVAALRATAKPGVVDSSAPHVAVTSRDTRTVGATQTIELSGTADDDFAIRAIRWRTDDGRSGAAKMRWVTDNPFGGTGQMSWSATGIPAHVGPNVIRITAEDTKGLTRRASVLVSV